MSVLLAFSLSLAGCSGDTIASIGTPDASGALTQSSTQSTTTARIASVTASPASLSIAVGTQAPITATVTDSKGNVVSSPTLSWTSSNPSVAAVTASGVVTGVAVGAAKITVIADNKRDFVDVTVVADPNAPSTGPVPASIAITVPSTSLYVGQSEQATAVVKDSSGNVITNAAVTWATSQAAVLAVSSGGVALGQSAGSASLSASTSGLTQSVGLTVMDTTSTTPVVDGSPCSTYSAKRVVPVATVSQLASALTNAQPGDRIELADGTYASKFSIYTSGTASAPIVLCGSRRAVLAQGVLSSGNGIYLKGSYWTFAGFSITSSQVGIAIVGGNNNVIDGLAIYNVGQAGVHMRGFSSRNVMRNSEIHDTGRYILEYGEGVYVGSYYGKWSTESGGLPDASNDNVISNNVIGPNIGSDLVDVKEGTSGTVIENNTLDGTGQGYSKSWNDTWIIVEGNNALLRGNRGKNAPVHGFRVTSTPAYPGLYGNNNTFENNAADVNAAGYGFKIDSGVSGNMVRCTNTVTNAGSGYSNVRCSQ